MSPGADMVIPFLNTYPFLYASIRCFIWNNKDLFEFFDVQIMRGRTFIFTFNLINPPLANVPEHIIQEFCVTRFGELFHPQVCIPWGTAMSLWERNTSCHQGFLQKALTESPLCPWECLMNTCYVSVTVPGIFQWVRKMFCFPSSSLTLPYASDNTMISISLLLLGKCLRMKVKLKWQ